MGDEIDSEWYHKYKSIKSKYKELKKIRIESVITDTEDLKQKIEEHKKIHETSINELNQQNSDLQESIQDVDIARKDIRRLKESISSIQQKLKNYDVILKEFVGRKNFLIKCIGHHLYQITYEDNTNQNRNSLTFIIGCHDNGFTYKFVKTNFSIPKQFNFLYQEIIFKNLNDFVANLLKALPK